MSHLGPRISALVDGQLGHEARDRALAHVAHCGRCRAELEAERTMKERMSQAGAPRPSPELTAMLLSLADPGDPIPPAPRRMPLTPVVPTLPPPGRSRLPGGRADARRPATVRAGAALGNRRVRYAAVGAVSFAGLMLGTAFAAGGSQPGTPVLPPTAELSTEHTAATSGLPLRDPAFDAVTTSFGGLTVSGDLSGIPAR